MKKILSAACAICIVLFTLTTTRLSAETPQNVWNGFASWIFTQVWIAPYPAMLSLQEKNPLIRIYIDMERTEFLSPKIPPEWRNIADIFMACNAQKLFPEWNLKPPYQFEIISSPSTHVPAGSTVVPEYLGDGLIETNTCAQIEWDRISPPYKEA